MSLPNDELAVNFTQLSQLYVLQNILIEMQKNIEFIETGQTGQTIYANNINLYQLAAKYYGDATQWTTIAQANGLSDPFIPAGQTVKLIIPSSSSPSGGILDD
jgi:LysM domain